MSENIIKMLMIYLIKNIIHFLVGEFLISEPTPAHHLTIFLINGIGAANKEATFAINIKSRTISRIPDIWIIWLKIITTGNDRIFFYNSKASICIIGWAGFMITTDTEYSDRTIMDKLLQTFFAPFALTIIHKASITQNNQKIIFFRSLMVLTPVFKPFKITMSITGNPNSIKQHIFTPNSTLELQCVYL